MNITKKELVAYCVLSFGIGAMLVEIFGPLQRTEPLYRVMIKESSEKSLIATPWHETREFPDEVVERATTLIESMGAESEFFWWVQTGYIKVPLF
jgi:hypothetical protein